MAQRDYYEVLGVEKTASDAEIKHAYRRAALQYHPDRNSGDESAAARFREAAEAYEVLSEPETRQQYDRYGHGFNTRHAAHEQTRPSPPPHQEPSDIMEELYIELGWMLVNEHGRYIPADIFEVTFHEELQNGIKLPFISERTHHPATHVPVVWMKKIKKSGLKSRKKTGKARSTAYLKESLEEVGLSMEDLSFSELFEFSKDIGMSIGVKVLKTLVGRK
ncbi:hypothetical protein CSB45_09890 [candidate division KSB3 bacterium]|uniref:J domain-containing protein n=1 Tax=candidate division KSB3 bacterium TaxID=2044937 RepID=A0A2G6E3S5_9BACT|nr:MAG: hypothetical protein CSB45_09890 [candidate division KSB3 bacterium]PIE29371.1 MAG: hypothetical protein CSA57_09200 [candidate division KSB3 bacterium]